MFPIVRAAIAVVAVQPVCGAADGVLPAMAMRRKTEGWRGCSPLAVFPTLHGLRNTHTARRWQDDTVGSRRDRVLSRWRGVSLAAGHLLLPKGIYCLIKAITLRGAGRRDCSHA